MERPVRMLHRSCLAILLFSGNLSTATAVDEQIFSGPQLGEKLLPFAVRGVFDNDAGKELDFVTQAASRPIILIFVHDLNRQSVSFTRILSQYTNGRTSDGLQTGIVWLADDATQAEKTLQRIRHALAPGVPIGISTEGLEGPGSYGLNRKVMLTILVGRDGVVTGNFALIQPSLQADLPKVLESVVGLVGGEVPRVQDLEGMRDMMKTAAGADESARLRPLLAPVIRRDASPEDVDRAARAVEEYVAGNTAARAEVGRIANTIIDAGKLENYGTARAREYLQKWAKAYGKSTKDDNRTDPKFRAPKP